MFSFSKLSILDNSHILVYLDLCVDISGLNHNIVYVCIITYRPISKIVPKSRFLLSGKLIDLSHALNYENLR